MTRPFLTPAALLGALAALALTSAAGAALAQDGAREMPRFEALDTDGDGRITREELEARADARFAEADADGDGKLTPAELEAAAEKRRAERIARMVERLDADGDGALDRGELTERRGAGRIFERLDADSDGALTREEFAALRGMRGAHRGGVGRP
jgi:Ca2+-binding EF-hand superfamily protein